MKQSAAVMQLPFDFSQSATINCTDCPLVNYLLCNVLSGKK